MKAALFAVGCMPMLGAGRRMSLRHDERGELVGDGPSVLLTHHDNRHHVHGPLVLNASSLLAPSPFKMRNPAGLRG